MKDKIKQLKELCEAATKGPWAPEEWTQISEDRYVTSIKSEEFYICSLASSDESGTYDAEFIAESRTALPVLIEVIEEMREGLEFINTKTYSDQMCNAELNARATSIFTESGKTLTSVTKKLEALEGEGE